MFLLRRAGTSALLLHEPVEARRVDGQPAFTRHQFRQIQRETLFVIETESKRVGNPTARADAIRLGFEQGDAFIEGTVESFLLATQNLFDVGLLGPQFGEDIAHGVSEHAGEFVEKGFVESERPTVAHGAAQNTAQDVVAVVIPGRNSVGHGEAERPRVVGNDAKSDIDFFLLAMSGRAGLGQRRSVFFAAEFLDLVEERTEDVRFVIRNAGV